MSHIVHIYGILMWSNYVCDHIMNFRIQFKRVNLCFLKPVKMENKSPKIEPEVKLEPEVKTEPEMKPEVKQKLKPKVATPKITPNTRAEKASQKLSRKNTLSTTPGSERKASPKIDTGLSKLRRKGPLGKIKNDKPTISTPERKMSEILHKAAKSRKSKNDKTRDQDKDESPVRPRSTRTAAKTGQKPGAFKGTCK